MVGALGGSRGQEAASLRGWASHGLVRAAAHPSHSTLRSRLRGTSVGKAYPRLELGLGGRVHVRTEGTPQTSALAATTGSMTKCSVSSGGGMVWQGTGKPHPEEQFCLPLLCSLNLQL